MTSINDLATAAIANATGSKSPRGSFIVLEGLDRSGKTTQVKLLEQRFVEEGRPVKMMRFPGTSSPVPELMTGKGGEKRSCEADGDVHCMGEQIGRQLSGR